MAIATPQPVLFVAREPDETLRTYLPLIDELAHGHGIASRVLFHHAPGDWALSELASRDVSITRVELPPRRASRVPLSGRLVATVGELVQLSRAKRLAHDIIDRHRPSALVVIQDTLLLERFLVRRANALDIPTLVIQWAFNYPQAIYDRLRDIKRRAEGRTATASSGAATGAYRALQRALGVQFDLANTYGGGEAHALAVWGPEFANQYRSQGAVNKDIIVTGHPTHDVAHALKRRIADSVLRDDIRRRYGIDSRRPMVLYATQPVLWRRVMAPQDLEANVRSMALAIAASPGQPELVLKLHPRENAADYQFCERLDPPVRVIPTADVSELIGACDLFVSSSSSTVLLAMMLDRPIVTVNFNEVPHFDYFESVGGTLHTRSPGEFAAAVRLALEDPATRELLARQRADVLARYTRFDGGATQRLAAIIANAHAPDAVRSPA